MWLPLAVLTQAWAPLPMNVPFRDTPASIKEERRIEGAWDLGIAELDIEVLGVGRASITIWANESSMWIPIFFTENNNQMFAWLDFDAASPMEKYEGSPAPKSCMFPVIAIRLDKDHIETRFLDVDATARANPWLHTEMSRDNTCPIFLTKMLPADQRRMKVVMNNIGLRPMIWQRLHTGVKSEARTYHPPPKPITDPRQLEPMKQ